MSQHNHAQQQQQRKAFFGKREDEDEYTQSFVAMLNVLRRYYDLTGDVFVKPILEKAERALARSR
jgi:hypothetical protein